MTAYLVFELYEGDAHPIIRAPIVAASADAAVRAALVGQEKGRSDTFVAVPARSWNPVKVTTETKTVLKLEDVEDILPARNGDT